MKPKGLIAKLGRYEISKRIGSGAMGEVYEAIDRALDRLVALKTIRSENSADAPGRLKYSVDSFMREARIVAKLDHPGIVKVYDIGEADGISFFVMELARGRNLQQRIKNSADLRLGDRLDIIIQLARALDYAHAAGVVHRDVKPSNVIITHAGVAKITDFGIAKLRNELAARSRNGSARAYGQPSYISPEQLEGAPVDHTTDIYSLGALSYRLLTGSEAFTGVSPKEIFHKIRFDRPEPPSRRNRALPVELDEIIERAMAKNRADRYGRAAEMAEDLEMRLDMLRLSKIDIFEQVASKQGALTFLRENYPLFSRMTDLEAIEALNFARSLEYSSNDTICAAGTRPSKIFLLMKGKVRLSLPSPDGKERPVSVIGSGGLFGVGSAIESRERRTLARALTDCSILAISESVLRVGSAPLKLKIYKELASALARGRRAISQNGSARSSIFKRRSRYLSASAWLTARVK